MNAQQSLLFVLFVRFASLKSVHFLQNLVYSLSTDSTPKCAVRYSESFFYIWSIKVANDEGGYDHAIRFIFLGDTFL